MWWNELSRDEIKIILIFISVVSILIIIGIYVWPLLVIFGGWLLGMFVGAAIGITLIELYEDYKWRKFWNNRKV